MGLRVWVLHTQTHAHKSAGSSFCPINKPMGSEVNQLHHETLRQFRMRFQLTTIQCRLNDTANAKRTELTTKNTAMEPSYISHWNCAPLHIFSLV